MLQIRKRRGSTIEDVRKLFEPLSGRPNCHLVEVFLRGSPQEASRAELRSNRIRSNDLHYQIQRLQSERPQLQLSRLEAERALKQASTENAENIQAEAKRRKEGLEQLEESIKGAESESRDLDKKVCDQEAYRYCSELLDFLQSRSGARNPSARSALNPLNLANALAGLPEMGVRQSYNRCSRLPEERYKHQHFQVFEIISQIWDRRPEDFEDAPVGFFRTELLKLHKKDEGTRILLEKWRDLRIAIEECWNQKHSADFMPHAITAAFFKNLYREKNDADKVMDAQERLLPG